MTRNYIIINRKLQLFIKGPAIYYAANGASEERTYCDGVSHGPATLYLPNGDSEERMYENGKLHGIATFVSHTGDRLVVRHFSISTLH